MYYFKLNPDSREKLENAESKKATKSVYVHKQIDGQVLVRKRAKTKELSNDIL